MSAQRFGSSLLISGVLAVAAAPRGRRTRTLVGHDPIGIAFVAPYAIFLVALFGYPLVIASGTGSSVEDVDGNLFLDFAAGIAVNSTGHSHPEVVAAIVDQSQKFLHMSGTDFYYEPQVRLAEEIGRIVPIDGGVKSFFSNSGTEANEAAIKLARYRSTDARSDRSG